MCGMAVVQVAGTTFKMATLYLMYRFIGMRRYHLGLRLFRAYLFQPYSFMLNQSSAELSKNVLTEVDQVINDVLRPAMEAFAATVVGGAILVFLFVTSPLVALAAVAAAWGLRLCGLQADAARQEALRRRRAAAA